tara:strand:- start:460 stop:780 length:321 start_codon:yes stop_codon:yes gene_type:complete
LTHIYITNYFKNKSRGAVADGANKQQQGKHNMEQTKYYILAIDYGSGYGVEFGSFKLAEVIEENKFQKLGHQLWPVDKCFKSRIIKTIENQAAINAEINKLNNNTK